MRADTKITRSTGRGTRRRAVPVIRTVSLPLLVSGTVLALTGAIGLWQILPGQITPTAGAGHGRGMSQVGAFDNARAGWTAEEILGHYYPGADLGQIGATEIGVRLQAQDDATLDTFAAAGAQVAGRMIGPGDAAHLTPLPDGGANVVVTAGCDGEVLWQAATDDPFVYPIGAGAGRPAEEHLTLCGGTAYRGALGVALEGESFRTVNQVDLDDYLAACTARGDAGQLGRPGRLRSLTRASDRGPLLRAGRESLRLRPDLRHHRLPGLSRYGERGFAQYRGGRRDHGHGVVT